MDFYIVIGKSWPNFQNSVLTDIDEGHLRKVHVGLEQTMPLFEGTCRTHQALTMGNRAEHEEPLVFSLLPLCSRQLGVQGLACIASCSTQAKLVSIKLGRADATDVVLGTLEAAKADAAAATEARSSCKQAEVVACWQPVQNLLQTVPAAMNAAGAANSILWCPSIPLQHALQWVNSGVRIHYAELLDAASCAVPGVQVWVKAQHQLGIHTDIPEAARAVCLGKVWVRCSSSKTEDAIEHVQPSCKSCTAAAPPVVSPASASA